jgi:hypothetical protein
MTMTELGPDETKLPRTVGPPDQPDNRLSPDFNTETAASRGDDTTATIYDPDAPQPPAAPVAEVHDGDDSGDDWSRAAEQPETPREDVHAPEKEHVAGMAGAAAAKAALGRDIADTDSATPVADTSGNDSEGHREDRPASADEPAPDANDPNADDQPGTGDADGSDGGGPTDGTVSPGSDEPDEPWKRSRDSLDEPTRDKLELLESRGPKPARYDVDTNKFTITYPIPPEESGMITGTLHREADPPTATLDYMDVSEDVRGFGLGRMLVDNFAAEVYHETDTFDVTLDNPAALGAIRGAMGDERISFVDERVLTPDGSPGPIPLTPEQAAASLSDERREELTRMESLQASGEQRMPRPITQRPGILQVVVTIADDPRIATLADIRHPKIDIERSAIPESRPLLDVSPTSLDFLEGATPHPRDEKMRRNSLLEGGWGYNDSGITDYNATSFNDTFPGAPLNDIIAARVGTSPDNVGMDIMGGSNGVALHDLMAAGVIGQGIVTNEHDEQGPGARENPNLHHVEGDILQRQTWEDMILTQREVVPEGLAVAMWRPIGAIQHQTYEVYQGAAHAVVNMLRPGGVFFAQVPQGTIGDRGPGPREFFRSFAVRGDVERVVRSDRFDGDDQPVGLNQRGILIFKRG